MERGAQASAKKFSESTGSLLKAYALLTVVCFLFDIIEFFVQVSKYGNEEKTAFAAVALLLLAFFFLAMDVYYFLWAVSVKMKLP